MSFGLYGFCGTTVASWRPGLLLNYMYISRVSECFCLAAIELEVTNLADDCRTRVTIHAIQLMPQQPYRAHESYATLTLEPEQNDSMILPIVVSCSNAPFPHDLISNNAVTCRVVVHWRCA